MAPAIRLRPATADDRELLYRIYASTRQEELATVDWSEEQKAAFLRQQFEAQDHHYREHYPDARFDVVEADGEAAGRLYVDVWTSEIRLVDIALLPRFRGAGLGTRLLEGLFDQARESGKRLTIHVEHFNRALGLYERLGFRRIGEVGVYYLMEWRPEEGGAAR